VRHAAQNNRNIVAVLFEVIQGEGGINLGSVEFVLGLRELCDEQGWLMMCDEVQCGTGRTGRWFGFQHAGVVPDVATLAKGLGSGVPIGACLTAGRAAGLFKPGNHGSTFGGNPLACTAAMTTLSVIEEEGLLGRAQDLGTRIREDFRRALADVPGVAAIRGDGLMIGIELDRPCGKLVERALEHGLLINVTAERVVRLLPPLILSDKEATHLVDVLAPLIREFLAP
jgi:acetylornithine aminotransferase